MFPNKTLSDDMKVYIVQSYTVTRTLHTLVIYMCVCVCVCVGLGFKRIIDDKKTHKIVLKKQG